MSTPTIKIAVSQADATLVQTTTLTAGMQNLPVVKFSFTDEWAGLGKTAVCRAGSVCLDVLVLNDQITVPYECLETAGVNLIIGIYGADTQIVIPTVWCSAGEILDGTDVEEASNVGEPTTELVDQMLGYAEDVATAAQTLEDYAIRNVNVDDDDADDYGIATVEASLSGSGETRALNLKFSDLKGNGIESVEFSELGTYRGRLQITESDGTVTTFDGIKDALDYLDDLTDESEESALKAEGYAVGTQDGDPSQTYATINAQYFAGVASTAATNAGTAKTAAETAQGKAEAAQGKAEDAQTAAEAAATSASGDAGSASGSASSAASSASSASESASAAASARDDAEDAADTATAAATAASGSASDASDYASAASGYATNASNSATAASGSANSASGSATSASTNALKAEGFAVGEQNGTAVASGSPYYHNNAEYYASEAADSATAAAGSASDAAESAATFTTDTTLSVSGKAADAKATGDALTSQSEKIDELKSALKIENSWGNLTNSVKNTNRISLVWTQGKGINSTGDVQSFSNNVYGTLDYYPVKEGDILFLKVYAPGSDYCALYDTAKNFVDYVRTPYVDGTRYTVPQDGFMRFSNENSKISIDSAYVEVMTDHSTYSNILADNVAEGKIIQHKASNTNDVPLTWTNGAYIDSTGKVSEYSNVAYTKGFYYFDEGTELSINVYASGSLKIVVYDTDKSIVTSFNATSLPISYTMPNDGFIRFSNSISQLSLDDAYVRITNSDFKTIEEIEEKLADIENSTIGLNGKIITVNPGFSDFDFSCSGTHTIVGHNLLDVTKVVTGKILNNSGVEVTDNTSFYYNHLIPVAGVEQIKINTPIQRLYVYDSYKEFVRRTGLLNYDAEGYVYRIPVDASYIQIQVQTSVMPVDADKVVIAYNGDVGTYTAYQSNKANTYYDGGFSIYADDLSNISAVVKYSFTNTMDSMVEPDNVLTGYSMPRELAQALRSNWTATDKYTYYPLLEKFFDCYLGTYNDGYVVSKCSLGDDGSQNGYEVFEYEFCPKNYKKTVLISSGMNSNEISAVWGIMTFMRDIMNHKDSRMVNLYNNVRFCILPFICPYSFDQEPMNYYNHNDVRVNKNFNYKTSWSQISESTKGNYPDSEEETKILKSWVNSHSSNADVWCDCHSDHTAPQYRQTRMCDVICSDNTTLDAITNAEAVYKAFYVASGYADSSTDNPTCHVENGTVYPKTLYGYKVCGIHSIMIEQTIGTTTFGSDGETINDSYGIKNYYAMLRLFISAVLSIT